MGEGGPTPEKATDEIKDFLSELKTLGREYTKGSAVMAEEVTAEQEVVTSVPEGEGSFKETRNKAMPGDWIVTNPRGEKYVVNAKTFNKDYKAVEGKPGHFDPKGHRICIKNPLGKPISMVAPWGELIKGKEDCWIAATYDPKTGEMSETDVYIIHGDVFNETYVLA